MVLLHVSETAFCVNGLLRDQGCRELDPCAGTRLGIREDVEPQGYDLSRSGRDRCVAISAREVDEQSEIAVGRVSGIDAEELAGCGIRAVLNIRIDVDSARRVDRHYRRVPVDTGRSRSLITRGIELYRDYNVFARLADRPCG